MYIAASGAAFWRNFDDAAADENFTHVVWSQASYDRSTCRSILALPIVTLTYVSSSK